MAAFEADPEAVYAVAGRFFGALAAAGVEHVVVSPGSRSTPLAITARHVPGLRTWIDLDERAAAFFALGLAKASGRPAVLVCTSGTAAANYLPAIVEAHYARVPMIVATADRPPERRDWGVGQTIEQVGLYGRYARWAVDLPVPEAGEDALRHAEQVAARAFATASGRPAGAVHLNWPLREPLPPPEGRLMAILEASREALNAPRTRRAHAIARPEDVSWLAQAARESERGVLCVGPMEEDPVLADAIAGFATAAGWPVLCDPASNLRAGGDSKRAPLLDAGDVLTRAPGFAAAHAPDVVLRIGDLSVSKAQRLWIQAASPGEVVWLDEGGQWGDPSLIATRVLRGGAASLLTGASAALAALAGRDASAPLRERAWCRAFEAANVRARDVLDAHAGRDRDFGGLAVAAAVTRLAPAESQLFAANSMSIRWLDLGFACREAPLRVFSSRGAAGIDGLNSTALGVAAAEGRPTILLSGDLAFLHDLSGLLLARRERIPLTIVVVDDEGGGIFSMLPVASQGEAVAYEELFRTPHGIELAKVSALFGFDHHRATGLEGLEAALGRAFAHDGVSIVHVPVEAATNMARYRATIAAARDAVEARS